MYNPPIEINVPEIGMVRLRALTVGDLEFIEDLVERDPPARDFVVQLLAHQMLSAESDVHTIRSWTDSTLETLITAWQQRVLKDTFTANGGSEPFDQAKTAISRYLEDYRKRLAELFAKLSPSDQVLEEVRRFAVEVGRNATATIEAVQASLRAAVNVAAISTTQQQIVSRALGDFQSVAVTSALLAQNIGAMVTTQLEQLGKTLQRAYQPINFVARLPNITDFIRAWEDLNEAADALDAAGYGFASDLMTVQFARAFIRVPSRVRAAVATNHLLRLTRQETFVDSIREVMEPSLMLKRRRSIVARALTAHQDRDYLVSIPLLLTQVEGAFTDMMILKRYALPQGGKLYARNLHGGAKLDKRGKPIRLNGLGQLIDHADFTAHPAVQSLCDHLANAVVPARNGILHGRVTSYARAKLSTELALLVFMLSSELVAFERGGADS